MHLRKNVNQTLISSHVFHKNRFGFDRQTKEEEKYTMNDSRLFYVAKLPVKVISLLGTLVTPWKNAGFISSLADKKV